MTKYWDFIGFSLLFFCFVCFVEVFGLFLVWLGFFAGDGGGKCPLCLKIKKS